MAVVVAELGGLARAGDEAEEVGVVAGDEREGFALIAGDGLVALGVLGFKLDGYAGDLDGLGGTGGGEGEVDTLAGADGKRQVPGGGVREAVMRDCYSVDAGVQRRDLPCAGGIREAGHGDTRLRVGNGDGGSGDDGTGAVMHGSYEGAGIKLGEGRGAHKQCGPKQRTAAERQEVRLHDRRLAFTRKTDRERTENRR